MRNFSPRVEQRGRDVYGVYDNQRDYLGNTPRPPQPRGRVSGAISNISHEFLRDSPSGTLMPHSASDQQTRSLMKYQAPALALSRQEERAIQEGIRHRQGLIDVHYADELGAIETLKHHVESLDGKSVVLSRKVSVHGLTQDPTVPSDQESTTYIALVSDREQSGRKGHEENTFRVPMTDIRIRSTRMLEEMYQWQHPAFDKHLGWLVHELGDIFRGKNNPEWIVSKRLRDSSQGVPVASALETAFVLSRSAFIKALTCTPLHGVSESLRSAPSPYGGEFVPSASRVAPRLDGFPSASSSRKVGQGWWTKLEGWVKKGMQPSMPSAKKVNVCNVSTSPTLPRGRHNLPAGWAFVDKQQASNLCGVAAINGFFQAPVITAGDAVKEIINTYLSPELVNENDVSLLPGLFHPEVVKAMREGREVSLSREDFFRATDVELNDLMYPMLSDEELRNDYGVEELAPINDKNQARVKAQWRSFFNYTHAGADDLADLIESSPRVTIHPETWITTFTGLSLEHLMNITNAKLLKLKKSNVDGRMYPKKVDCLTLSRTQAQRTHELEWLSMAVEELNVNHLICMGGGGMTGHYFALVKDTGGNWLKLDGLRPEEKSGTHKVSEEQQAQPGTLPQKLKQWRVSHVILDERVTQHFQHSLEK